MSIIRGSIVTLFLAVRLQLAVLELRSVPRDQAPLATNHNTASCNA